MLRTNPGPALGRPVIPRPERSPAALRAACAVVAPRSSRPYGRAKDQALDEAVERGSLAPVHAWLAHWAALIEIERHPEAAKRYRHAVYPARIATAPEEAREHLTTASALYREAASGAA
ncbi:DUF6247 family protein [Streptomyces sp. NPDC005017]|uniref:DUF6247 family protein n=1 Tax=Streptomyces sp. NPDC005017 TaxID=3364706 RepID=UPI0036BBB814